MGVSLSCLGLRNKDKRHSSGRGKGQVNGEHGIKYVVEVRFTWLRAFGASSKLSAGQALGAYRHVAAAVRHLSAVLIPRAEPRWAVRRDSACGANP